MENTTEMDNWEVVLKSRMIKIGSSSTEETLHVLHNRWNGKMDETAAVSTLDHSLFLGLTGTAQSSWTFL